jgi:hypothetical protein
MKIYREAPSKAEIVLYVIRRRKNSLANDFERREADFDSFTKSISSPL